MGEHQIYGCGSVCGFCCFCCNKVSETIGVSITCSRMVILWVVVVELDLGW